MQCVHIFPSPAANVKGNAQRLISFSFKIFNFSSFSKDGSSNTVKWTDHVSQVAKIAGKNLTTPIVWSSTRLHSYWPVTFPWKTLCKKFCRPKPYLFPYRRQQGPQGDKNFLRLDRRRQQLQLHRKTPGRGLSVQSLSLLIHRIVWPKATIKSDKWTTSLDYGQGFHFNKGLEKS